MYSYLKCIVYDRLLKPQHSFQITLYIQSYFKDYILWTRQKKRNVNYITYNVINNLSYLTYTLHIHYASSD